MIKDKPEENPNQINPANTLAKIWPVIKLIASRKPKLKVLNKKAKTSRKTIKGISNNGVPAGKKTATK